MDFKIEDLFKYQKNKQEHKRQVFSKVLEQCIKRIKFVNKNSNSSCIVYTIPSIIPGQPLYNISECSEYLLYELENLGFKTEAKDHQNIIISWSQPEPVEQPEKEELNMLTGLSFNTGSKRKRK
jgi:hypothetical protein